MFNPHNNPLVILYPFYRWENLGAVCPRHTSEEEGEEDLNSGQLGSHPVPFPLEEANQAGGERADGAEGAEVASHASLEGPRWFRDQQLVLHQAERSKQQPPQMTGTRGPGSASCRSLLLLPTPLWLS